MLPAISVGYIALSTRLLRVGPNEETVVRFFAKISAFYRNMRGLNLHEYEPQLARKTIVRPAQNRHYSNDVRGGHPHGCPTGVGLTRRQVSVPWGVKSITNLSCYNTQRDKSFSYYRQRASSVGHLGAVTLSTRRREFRISLHLLRSAMTCQRPWERPCSVSCAREWWHSSSGAASQSSTPLYLNFKF